MNTEILGGDKGDVQSLRVLKNRDRDRDRDRGGGRDRDKDPQLPRGVLPP